MVPVALMHRPAVGVVIVVRVAPVSTRIRRSPPCTGDPHIPCSNPVPISIGPHITGSRDRRWDLIAQGWRSNADIHANPRKSRSRKCRSQDQTRYPFRLHTFLLTTTFHSVLTRSAAGGFAPSHRVVVNIVFN